MRYTAIVVSVVVIVLGVMFGGMIFGTKTEYIKSEPEVIKEEVKVDALEKAILDAQEAKKTEIVTVAQKAYDEAYAQEMRKVELEVIKLFNTKLDDRQKNLEKQTNEY